MADIVSKKKRSEIMSRIRGKDTTPEWVVRRLAHGMGYRYRLHVKKLPGCPDLVFPSRRMAIWIHGCFWHLHKGCGNARIPSSRRDFWEKKLKGNAARDRRDLKKLENDGWKVLVIWECQVGNDKWLRRQVESFLERGRILKPPPPTKGGKPGRRVETSK